MAYGVGNVTIGTRSLGNYFHGTMRAMPRYGSFDDAVMHNEDRLSSRKRTDLTKQGGDNKTRRVATGQQKEGWDHFLVKIIIFSEQ